MFTFICSSRDRCSTLTTPSKKDLSTPLSQSIDTIVELIDTTYTSLNSDTVELYCNPIPIYLTDDDIDIDDIDMNVLKRMEPRIDQCKRTEAIRYFESEIGYDSDDGDTITFIDITSAKNLPRPTDMSPIIYHLKGVNLNTIAIAKWLDDLSVLFDEVYVVKLYMSRQWDDEVYVICSAPRKVKLSESEKWVPINCSEWIEFLYSMYSHGLHALRIMYDMEMGTRMTAVPFVEMTAADEYRLWSMKYAEFARYMWEAVGEMVPMKREEEDEKDGE